CFCKIYSRDNAGRCNQTQSPAGDNHPGIFALALGGPALYGCAFGQVFTGQTLNFYPFVIKIAKSLSGGRNDAGLFGRGLGVTSTGHLDFSATKDGQSQHPEVRIACRPSKTRWRIPGRADRPRWPPRLPCLSPAWWLGWGWSPIWAGSSSPA